MSDLTYDPASHYDRVTDAWSLLLGDDLHYGVFDTGAEPLSTATRRLTDLMAEAADLRPGLAVLDVGCGTGSPACYLASRFAVDVVGITTSDVGVREATARAAAGGLSSHAAFRLADGMDNGLPDASFDRVWVLESSHLMRDRAALIDECARVLRPGGRLALCDIMLRRPLPFEEVRRLRRPLMLLREVFGDARMEPLDHYVDLASRSGLDVELHRDLTAATRPTFSRWRDNAAAHHDRIMQSLSEADLQQFVASCDVLEGFWDDGTLGYGLIATTKP